jgi:hypothetical protein
MPHDTERTELRIDRLKDRPTLRMCWCLGVYVCVPASSFVTEGEVRWHPRGGMPHNTERTELRTDRLKDRPS